MKLKYKLRQQQKKILMKIENKNKNNIENLFIIHTLKTKVKAKYFTNFIQLK